MGHIHLGRLPATRKWREVTELLTAGSDAQDVAAASAIAAESDLLAAANDPHFVETVRLLSLIPQAAKQDDFVKALREIGIDAPASPSLLDLMIATTVALDRFATREKCRSDFGELSARALADSLAAAVGARLPTLRATRHYGRALWKRLTGYHDRSRAEAKMQCLKSFGERIAARDHDRQTAEIHIRVTS